MLNLKVKDLLDILADAIAERLAPNVVALIESRRPRYYGREELARLVHVSLPTIHKWCKTGKLNPLKINGRTLFDANEVDALINDGTLKPRSHD